MSIALDVALYIREHNVKNLTLAARGVLFTLLFRVGSNPFTWVSQETLATECQVATSNIKTHMNKLRQIGLIIVQKDPKDKRRNLYRPAEFLINYHQQNNRESTKKYSSKSGSTFKNTAQNQAVNTARNQAVSPKQIDRQPVDNKKENTKQISPKAKEQSKSVIKQKREFVVDKFKINCKNEDTNEVKNELITQRQNGLKHIQKILGDLRGKMT